MSIGVSQIDSCDWCGLEGSVSRTYARPEDLSDTSVMAQVLPSGQVTFAFTDVVGSTLAFTDHGQAYVDAMPALHAQIEEVAAAHGGVVVKTEGDGAFLAFPDAAGAVRALREMQERLDQRAGRRVVAPDPRGRPHRDGRTRRRRLPGAGGARRRPSLLGSGCGSGAGVRQRPRGHRRRRPRRGPAGRGRRLRAQGRARTDAALADRRRRRGTARHPGPEDERRRSPTPASWGGRSSSTSSTGSSGPPAW